jgi:phosphatidylinositol alpha-1,6-mannosyltransferase
MEAAWAAADVFVMPARTEPGGDTEGYGLVFLEAGLRGLPVIGGRGAGAEEAVIHGVTGLLLDDPSDAAALAAVLRCLADDPVRGKLLGAAGRRRVLAAHRPAHLARAVQRALVAEVPAVHPRPPLEAEVPLRPPIARSGSHR